MFIRVLKPWPNQSVAEKSLPDCQFRFLGIDKIGVKANAHRVLERGELQNDQGY